MNEMSSRGRVRRSAIAARASPHLADGITSYFARWEPGRALRTS